ncbi:MAG: endopeptidase La [Acidobacteriota bacterium]
MTKKINRDASELLEKKKARTPKIDKPGLVLAGETLPASMPILPIRPRPFFPGLHIPLEVREEQLPVVTLALESSTGTLGIVLVKDVQGDDGLENLHRTGVAAKIVKAVTEEPGTAHILISCLERFSIKDIQETDKGLFARVEYHYATALASNLQLKAYSMAIISALKDLMALNPLHAEVIRLFLSRSSLDDPGQLADFSASLTTADGQDLQKILEAFDVRKRLDQTLVLLKKEIEIFKLQKQITDQIEEKMTSQQREFFLREQLKAIKQELGLEKDGKAAEVEKFQQRLEGLTLNPEAQQAVDEELEKLQILEPISPEYTVTRNYLDWLTILPWGKLSQDSYDLDLARKILDQDHYGLDDVKTRILEFIAVGKIKGDIAGSILCLVGPPGVGKTSVGRSVAHALGRQFYRFSLGGMRDEAEIKGHRRTYIGAMPGKLIQALKTAGTANPVIMLDEIDKVGASFRGDPASALLEVLDIEQNPAFRDHYLDVPFDLSDVLFITTANQLDTVPLPLIDRMEVIRLSGYILEEKVEIARRYLIPKALDNFGIKKTQISIRKSALKKIIEGYAREAGVRGLEKLVRKIFRKGAVELANHPKKKLVVTPANVESYLGHATFTDQELLEGRPGVVTGLAWTSLGGATLQIEATAVLSRRKGFKQTGQLGSVMVESSEIAYSYVMAHLDQYGVQSNFFDQHFVHLHVPAGATPKDGPSAGVTMATALISMIRQKTVKKGLAMSGELTLTGRVLPIGGVKEKVIAARRIGLKKLIFPQDNQKDVDALPDYLRKGLTFLFAADFEDVYRQAFRNRRTRKKLTG